MITLRGLRILMVLAKHRLDDAIPSLGLQWLGSLVRLVSFQWRKPKAPYEIRLRLALEQLGPLFIKFGQLLSTRADLFPPAIIDELSQLQDRVPPFDSRLAQQILLNELGRPIQDAFASFEDQPMAAASIAQVHGATLVSGERVVVKILRPDVRAQVRKDLRALYRLARWLAKRVPQLQRFRLLDIVQEMERVLSSELNLRTEGANASLLRHYFDDSPLIYVPKVFWSHTTESVLVLERLQGIRISDRDALVQAGIDIPLLAKRGVEVFFRQAFTHGFFHADMHPGNVFVNPHHPHDPQYMAVDFGIMGTLGAEDRYYLAANMMAFFERDYRRIAQLHVESGWVAKDTSVDHFESTIRTICEPIVGKPFSEISFAQCLAGLLHAAQTFDMVVQPQLLLLQKTLFNIEGLGRELYPELDLWTTAKPFLQRWLREQYSIRGFWKRLRRKLPKYLLDLDLLD